MDGIEVINPYRLYGVVSMYNPQTVENVRLLSGGFPVRYSDRLSAVVDVTNRDGSLTDGPFNARANLSLTNLNIVAEGAFLLESRETDDSARSDLFYREDSPPWNGSWLVSTRRTYYDLLAGPIVKSAGIAHGEIVLPNFQDFQFRLALQPDYRHKIVFTGITNRDRAHLDEASAPGSIEKLSLDDLTFNDVAGIQWIWTHSQTMSSDAMVFHSRRMADPTSFPESRTPHHPSVSTCPPKNTTNSGIRSWPQALTLRHASHPREHTIFFSGNSQPTPR